MKSPSPLFLYVSFHDTFPVRGGLREEAVGRGGFKGGHGYEKTKYVLTTSLKKITQQSNVGTISKLMDRSQLFQNYFYCTKI